MFHMQVMNIDSMTCRIHGRTQQCMCIVYFLTVAYNYYKCLYSISSAINAQNASLRSLVAESIASVQQIQQMHNAQSTAPWKQREVSDL